MFTINHPKLYLASFLLIGSLTTYAKPTITIQTWHTSHGSKVLFTEAHELPIFDINVVFYAGSAADGKNYGLANFTSATINAGTKNLTADQIADRFDQLGSVFYASASFDRNEIGLRCLSSPKTLNRAIQIFNTVLNEPSFPEKAVNQIKKQILTTIEQKKQYPDSVANDRFYQELYQDFPYSHPTTGITETISTINRKHLQDFYHRYYTARNALIIMVGDITRKEAEEIAEKLTVKLPLGEKILPRQTLPQKPKSVVKHYEFPSTQTNLIIGQLGIARNDPDYLPLQVGNHILGSPFISDLFMEIREKLGLVYGITSYFSPLLDQGPFIISFSSSNEKADLALQTTRKVLKSFLENGPTKEQLLAAKKNLTGKLPMRLSNNRATLSALQEIGFYNLPLDYFDTYIDKINAVTLKDIKDAFQRHIDLNSMLIITVGKKTKAAAALQKSANTNTTN